MTLTEIIRTHPTQGAVLNKALIHCIGACHECAQTCTSCADACLAEDMAQDLRDCIRYDLDCAAACVTAGTIALRFDGSDDRVLREMLAACRTACNRCAEVCESHAKMHAHCRLCAEACRQCEAACRDALASLKER